MGTLQFDQSQLDSSTDFQLFHELYSEKLCWAIGGDQSKIGAPHLLFI